MLLEPSSPTPPQHMGPGTGLAARPPPLTPYRGAAPPETSGAAAAASGDSTSPHAPLAAAAGSAAGALVGGGGRPQQLLHPAPPLWDQALEQERRLRGELRRKSFWDHDVRRLRGALQGTYEALLFSHYEFAYAHEVEPNLWKAVFYKPIEEFRSRTRALEAVVRGAVGGATTSPPVGGGGGGAAATAAAAVPQLASPEEARAQLARTTGAYLRFLDDALAFYRKTVWKLQWVHGSVGAVVDLDAALQNEIQECVPRRSVAGPGGGGGRGSPEARTSVHRCLIYLGDLCRYQSMALKERPTSARPLWERAMSYYRQAARVLPASGNPYNQMAVMSYYTNDELRAVYYYFRSLAVAMPFVTARENLLLLFEKNRNRYGSIAASHAAAALQGGHEAETRAAAGHVADVSVRFVRLHGMLFDRINLHQFPGVLTAAMHDLETLLGHPGCRAGLQKASEADQLLLQVAIMNIFSVHNVTFGGGGAAANEGGDASGGGSYAAAAKRAELLCHALAAAMRFAAVVTAVTASMAGAAAAGGGVGDVDTGFGAVSTACHVMLAWMVSNTEVLSPSAGGSGAGSGGRSGYRSGSFGGEVPAEVEAEVAARSAFLQAAARLAAHLSDLTRRRAHDQDWQDPAVRHRSLPEDSELAGFGPLAPVFSVAATWPAASEASGGAAVLAVRVARMLQALRHLDDALGPGAQRAAGVGAGGSLAPQQPLYAAPSSSAWQTQAASVAVPPAGSALAQELARAVRGFRNAVAQATGLAPAAAAGGAATATDQRHPALPPTNAPGAADQSRAHLDPQPHVLSAGPGAHAPGGNGSASSGGSGGQQQQEGLLRGEAHAAKGTHHAPAGKFADGPQQQLHPQPHQQHTPHSCPHAAGAVPGGGSGNNVSGAVEGAAAARPSALLQVASPPPCQQQPLPPQRHDQQPGSGVPSPPSSPLPQTLDVTAQQQQEQDPVTALVPPALDYGLAARHLSLPARSRTTVPASGDPTAAAAAATSEDGGGGGTVRQIGQGGEDMAEDEIVYQPPRPGPALPPPASLGNGLNQLHRRSSSGGGGGGGLTGGLGGVPQSQDGGGLLSKQPSSSSAAPTSLAPSRDVSRDGSALLLRSPSALSTGDLLTSGGAMAAAAAAAAAAAVLAAPQGLGVNLHVSIGAGAGRLSGSGLPSPGSAHGGTLPPSPRQLLILQHPPHSQHLHGWGDLYGSAGSGGGGGGSSGTGMVPAPGMLQARPPSPAVGELPEAGTIGLLQNLLHGGGGGGGVGLLLGGRRISSGATGTAAGAGAVSGRPGSSGSNAMRRPPPSACTLAGLGAALGPRPGSAAAATTVTAAPPPSHSHPPQVLQLDHPSHADDATMQPPGLAAAAATATVGSSTFAGLPDSLQERAQLRQPQSRQQHQQHQQLLTQSRHPPAGGSGLMLLTSSTAGQPQRPSAAAAAAGLGQGPGPGVGFPGHLALHAGSFPHPNLLPFGVGGGTFAGLPVPGGAVAAAASGAAVGSGGGGGAASAPRGQLGWPAGVIAGAGGGGGGLDVSSLFTEVASNYQAVALAEATAEATAVAMADDVLQAMDEDDGGASVRSGGGGAGFDALSGGGNGGGGLVMYGGGEDYMDMEHFSPATAAAMATGEGGGPGGAGPVTREPSAGSDALFLLTGTSGGTASAGHTGTGMQPMFCSSGSGSRVGCAAGAVTNAAAAGGRGPPADGGAGQIAAESLAAGAAATIEARGGFGSWGVLAAKLPERLADYHRTLPRSGGSEAHAAAARPDAYPQGAQWTQAAAAAQLQQGQGQKHALGGGSGGGGLFGEDLSCLSYLAAQLQCCPAGSGGRGGGQGQGQVHSNAQGPLG